MASSQSAELKGIKGFNGSYGYFKEKEFLSVEEIYHSLPERSINKAGETMRGNILQTRSDAFLHLPVEFSISGLQHCTTMDSTRKILESQSFIGREHEREELKDLFFWSVKVPSTDIEKAREEAYTHVQEHVPPDEAKEYKEEITKQFANSPAFNNQASRYGNFRFSFQFSDLLSLYEAQFCEGKKPQLSILGTDVYKQEIAHYVVVHCPDSTRFKDHPRVPRLQTRCEPLPNVFLVDDTLYWRPESTSNALKVRTKDGHITACNQPKLCDWYDYYCHTVPCPWNHLVIAFHIPQGNALKIPVEKLIDHLSACSALDPFMKKNSRMEKYEAGKHIKDFQQQYLGRSQELRPKVDSSHGEQFGRRTDRAPLREINTNVKVKGEERRRAAKPNEKLHDCRAPTMENKEVTANEINNSTLQSEQFSQSMLDCQKQLITSIENLGKNLSEGFHSLCQELRNVTDAITSFQMDISRREHRPPSSIETKAGRKTVPTFTSSPSSSLQSDDLTTTLRVVDSPEEDGSQCYGEQKSLLNEDSLEAQMDGGKPAEEVDVGEQPSTHVRVKQERNGGSVTGKHAAKRDSKRGDPHIGESIKQYGPPLKKKKCRCSRVSNQTLISNFLTHRVIWKKKQLKRKENEGVCLTHLV